MSSKIGSKKALIELISKEIKAIKQKMNESDSSMVSKSIDPLKVDMKQNDKADGKAKAIVYKDKGGEKTKGGNVSSTEEVTKVKMNQNDKNQGSDKTAATAVEVKAGAEKGGNGPTSGQANAKFTSKTEQPSKDASVPYEDKFDGKMNINDKNIDDTAPKTYVEAGSEKGGNGVTAGQHNASIKHEAPKPKEEERISKFIQLKESYKKESSKKSYQKTCSKEVCEKAPLSGYRSIRLSGAN